LLGGLPLRVNAQVAYEPPPDLGLPGHREGGGTRGEGSCLQDPSSLFVAVMPEDGFGQTSLDAPTLYWYLPATNAETAEFFLLNEQDEEIYRATVSLPQEGGVVNFRLPTTVSNRSLLQAGEDYRWYFSLNCNPDDPSGNLVTQGGLRRIQLNMPLAEEIANTAPGDRPAIYASEGIWHDALISLVDLHQPGNPKWGTDWQSLLESVKLEAIADKPFAENLQIIEEEFFVR
jgi:Domain of Unknown Function (DUF928)